MKEALVTKIRAKNKDSLVLKLCRNYAQMVFNVEEIVENELDRVEINGIKLNVEELKFGFGELTISLGR